MAAPMEVITEEPNDVLQVKQQNSLDKYIKPPEEHISRRGRKPANIVPPDVLCNCPQRCNERIPQEERFRLFTEFCNLGDSNQQNEFLQSHIKTRAVQRKPFEKKPLIRSKRRVSCKYLIPLLRSDSDHIKAGPSPPRIKLLDVCQKAFMNIFAITEKRVRLQREKLVTAFVSRNLNIEHPSLTVTPIKHESTKKSFIPPVQQENTPSVSHNNSLHVRHDDDYFSLKALLTERQDDIAILDNFLVNQLWKPEYIKYMGHSLVVKSVIAEESS